MPSEQSTADKYNEFKWSTIAKYSYFGIVINEVPVSNIALDELLLKIDFD